MKKTYILLFLLFFIFLTQSQEKDKVLDFKLISPTYVVGSQTIKVEVQVLEKDKNLDEYFEGEYIFLVNNKAQTLNFQQGKASFEYEVKQSTQLKVISSDSQLERNTKIRYIDAWWSVVPPLLAIILALVFKEVILSIFVGVFAGAWILLGNPLAAVLSVADKYILNALYKKDHLSVILFTMIIGGMVAIISKNGGMAGIVKLLAKFANSVRNTKVVTWFLGILIFFDDYANTLIVGNTMRPMTDKYKISREKLAYIVDSTSAPVAAIAFVTTWIGAELSYIKSATESINIKASTVGWENINEGAYSIFLNSLQYSFYPIFALVFMVIIIYTRKDFGLMYKAEKRARTTGEVNKASSKGEEEEDEFKQLEPNENVQKRWYNAFIPILVVIIGTIAGLVYTGLDNTAQELAKISEGGKSVEVWQNLKLLNDNQEPSLIRKLGILLGNADAYITLIWASLLALIVAIILTVSQRIMSLQKTMSVMTMGFKTVLPAVLILLFAWALAGVNADLHTADFLSNLLSNGVSPYMLPAITFVLAGFIAFATGSSWGTMAILYPLILQATWETAMGAGLGYTESIQIFYHVSAVVLAGAVFGDHCSPISDTTILSSMASGCHHIEHVRTQLPYALTVGLVAFLASLVFFYLGLPWYLNFLLGTGILLGVVQIFGRRV